MSKKEARFKILKQIPTEALERHFHGLIDQAVLWLGAEAVIARAAMAQRESEDKAA